MKKELKIPMGGMYQEWMCLIDLIEEETVNQLEALAVENGWREVEPNEALNMGFDELVSWSHSETDSLVLVGDKYLVCLPKKTEYAN